MGDVHTERQTREIEYHREHANKHASLINEPVSLDVVTNGNRRWWNAYWSTYDILRTLDLKGKRVLVPGCGFGADAVRISSLGAEVFAFDLSPEVIEISKGRAEQFGYDLVRFDVMPSEALKYDADFFDLIFCLDILHHVDIPKTTEQFRRVLKSGGRIIGDELYTHGVVERMIRRNVLVDKVIYPKMVKYIYGSDEPYITEDEHKIDHNEFSKITDIMSRFRVKYYNFLVQRLVSDRSLFVTKADRMLTATLGGWGRYIAGRVVFDGVVD